MSNDTEDLNIDEKGRGFSFVGIVESMFSAVANGIGTFVTSIIGAEKNPKSRSPRVSYKNYQLIRLYPNSQGHVNELKELKEAEPEEIKFWTEPMYNKFVSLLSRPFCFKIKDLRRTHVLNRCFRTTDVVIGPDLVSEVKMFLREKGIDFKVLIPDLQVRYDISIFHSSNCTTRGYQ